MTALSEQFDVSRVIYREEPVTLHYLDVDPALAARAACDYHVRAGLRAAVVMLAAAWHQVNPMYTPLDAEPAYGHLFARRVLPPRSPQATLHERSWDPFYVEELGRSYWLLCGQKLPDRPAHADHPYCIWARSTAGNYRWVWAWGTALAAEHKHRWGALPPELPLLWTLEPAPPGTPDEPAAEPVPLGTGDATVIVDGYYDAVQSYRAAYVADKQPILKWTRRAPPPWLVQDPNSGLFSLYAKD